MSIWYSSKQYCLTLMKSLFYYSTEAIFPTICAVCNTCQKVSRSILYWWFFWRILTVIYVQQSFIIATENDGYVKIMMMTLVLQFQAAWHSMKRDSPLNFKKKIPLHLDHNVWKSLKMHICQNSLFWQYEFFKLCDFEHVNFWMKCGCLPQCELKM